LNPGSKATVTDRGAYGLVCVQRTGKINKRTLKSPSLIRFNELIEDEYFVTEGGANSTFAFSCHSEDFLSVDPH
jgi:hypothetical protein